MRILHDGASFFRAEKVERIARWPEARENLRVCLQGLPDGGNCCRCEKCQRVMMYFLLVGGGLPACFPRPLSAWNLLRTRYLTPGLLRVNEQVLYTARQRKARGSWVLALAAAIQLNRLRFFFKGWLPTSKRAS